jgi:hypothetical protein
MACFSVFGYGFGDCSAPGVDSPNTPLWNAIDRQWSGWPQVFGGPQDPRIIAALVIKGFMSVLGILFLAFVIYAGIAWMTAAGDEDKIRKAKGTLTTGIIGMVIILAAFSIAQFVVIAFGCATSSYGAWCLFFNNLSY